MGVEKVNKGCVWDLNESQPKLAYKQNRLKIYVCVCMQVKTFYYIFMYVWFINMNFIKYIYSEQKYFYAYTHMCAHTLFCLHVLFRLPSDLTLTDGTYIV